MITAVKELVGDRPAGTRPRTRRSCAGLGAATVLGFSANLGEGSTDSNIPMSMNVPAITIGGGGRGREAHALTESFDTTDAWMGTQHALSGDDRARAEISCQLSAEKWAERTES